MQLKPDQITSHLGKTLAPVYLLAGEEPLLAQEAADAIRARARSEGYSEREVLHVETGFDWHRLKASGENLSLFASRRIVELHMGDKGPGQEGAQALVEYLAALPTDTLFIAHAGRLDKRQRSSAWCEAFDRAGAVMYAWPVAPAELPRWIESRAAKTGLKIDMEAIELLAARTEGNLLACAQELAKLRLIYPDGVVDSARVLEAVADSARFAIGDLPQRALLGDAAGALQSLHRLEEEGEAAVLIIWTLARDLRILYQLTSAVAQGTPLERALAHPMIWATRKAAFGQAARRLKPSQVLALLMEVGRADRIAKGAEKGRIWEELVKLVARLAGLPLASGLPRRQAI